MNGELGESNTDDLIEYDEDREVLSDDGCEEYATASHDLFSIDDHQEQASKNKAALTNTNNATATAGYCVDSVEPKCNEIKRLIDEIKLDYQSKLDLLKKTKQLVQRLNRIKDYHSKGITLFNEQQQQASTNMNQEKAKKFLADIEEWMNNLDVLLNINNNNNNKSSQLGAESTSSFDSPDSSKLLTESFASLNLDSALLDLNVSHLSIKPASSDVHQSASSSVKRPGSGIVVAVDESMANNLKIKQLNTIKSIHVSIAQLRSLCEMFEKRQEQLKKMAYPAPPQQQPTGVVKPVQRVEPQVLLLKHDNSASSTDTHHE